MTKEAKALERDFHSKKIDTIINPGIEDIKSRKLNYPNVDLDRHDRQLLTWYRNYLLSIQKYDIKTTPIIKEIESL